MPDYDSGEILGMFWTLPREPERLVRPRALSREEQPRQDQREAVGPCRETQAEAWGQGAHLMRKGGAPALVSRDGMVPLGSYHHPQPLSGTSSQEQLLLCSLNLPDDWVSSLPLAGKVTIAHRLHCW